MNELTNPGTGNSSAQNIASKSELQIFDDLTLFSDTIKSETGFDFNFASLIDLHTDFIQSSDEFLLMNIKEYGTQRPDNILFLP